MVVQTKIRIEKIRKKRIIENVLPSRFGEIMLFHVRYLTLHIEVFIYIITDINSTKSQFEKGLKHQNYAVFNSLLKLSAPL